MNQFGVDLTSRQAVPAHSTLLPECLVAGKKAKESTNNAATSADLCAAPVYIVGPTASGKSEFAYMAAKALNGVIISADSMQIYRGLDIGTAKESPLRRSEIEHYMIDIIDADEEFSVAEYAVQAKAHVDNAIENHKVPFIVGGTGLYIESLLHPMSFAKTAKDPDLRRRLEDELERIGNRGMHDVLRETDPEAAQKIHPNDSKRIIRALEIALSTGSTKSRLKDSPQIAEDAVMIGFDCDRAQLYRRINERVDRMLRDGLIEEAARFIGREDLQSMQAIGYKEFAGCNFINEKGRMLLSDQELLAVSENIKKNTRNYAKRQLTWFRRYKFARWFQCGDYDGALRFITQQLQKS